MPTITDTDEDIVGFLNMKFRMGTLSVYVSRNFIKKYRLAEIVFNAKELSFRESTIFDTKTHAIHANSFCIKYMGNEDLVGEYNIIQPDENEKEFQLIRVK